MWTNSEKQHSIKDQPLIRDNPECKRRNINAIYKRWRGGKEDLGNYRPASLTYLPSKSMEKILPETVPVHMENEVTIENQHGLTKGKLCLTILVAFHNRVIALADKGNERHLPGVVQSI